MPSSSNPARPRDASFQGMSMRGLERFDPRPACPHCGAILPPAWSRDQGGRCPTCRLLIGADRAAVFDGRGERRAAAGVIANTARRDGARPGDPDEVLAALHAAATATGRPAARLRMLDYTSFSEGHPEMPTLSVVLSTFKTWKRARTQAAVHPTAGFTGRDQITPVESAAS